MSLADNLLRRLDVLESALTLKKNGIPEKIATITYSDRPEDIAEAKAQMLRHYDVPSEEVLEAAGSSIEVSSFPWAAGRSIGITSNIDPRIPGDLRDQALSKANGKIIGPVVGTMQDAEGLENPTDPE